MMNDEYTKHCELDFADTWILAKRRTYVASAFQSNDSITTITLYSTSHL